MKHVGQLVVILQHYFCKIFLTNLLQECFLFSVNTETRFAGTPKSENLVWFTLIQTKLATDFVRRFC